MDREPDVKLYVKVAFFVVLPIFLFLFSTYYYKPTMIRPIGWNVIYSVSVGVLALVMNTTWSIYDRLHGFFGIIIGGIISFVFIATLITLIVVIIIFFRIDIFFSLK